MFWCPGTERARGLAQTLLNVPYGEGDGEKLDAYIPSTNSLGMKMCRHPNPTTGSTASTPLFQVFYCYTSHYNLISPTLQ